MGNVNEVIRDHVEREYKRVKTKGVERDFLTINEAKKLCGMEDSPIDFKKLSVLFMLDVDKNGKFTLDDLLKFTEWTSSVTMHIVNNPQSFSVTFYKLSNNYQSELQAQCTLNMWRQINIPNGVLAFCDWFVRLFAVGMIVRVQKKEDSSDSEDDSHEAGDESPTPITPVQQYTNKLSKRLDYLFLNVDTVTTMYEILSIKELYGTNCQDLIDLMQRVGEEMGQLRLENEALDNVVPAKVIHLFAENFANGFLNMMSKLGFNYVDMTQTAIPNLKPITPRVDNTPETNDNAQVNSDSEGSDYSDSEEEEQAPMPKQPSFSVGSIMMSKLKLV